MLCTSFHYSELMRVLYTFAGRAVNHCRQCKETVKLRSRSKIVLQYTADSAKMQLSLERANTTSKQMEDGKMINLYQCEKCGKTFNSYEDCAKCEDSHVVIDWWASQEDVENQAPQWKENEALPTTVKLTGAIMYGDYDEAKQSYKMYRMVGTYKLIKTVKVEEIR